MGEYLNTDGEIVTVGIESVKPEPVENKVRYFYAISAEFVRKLDEPKREYFDGGYSVRQNESGQGFMADTIELDADAEVTRMGLLNYAIQELVERQNKMRTQQGYTIMFEAKDTIVKWFDCNRNAL